MQLAPVLLPNATAAGLVMAACISPSAAATKNWVGSTSDWSASTNWSAAGAPTSADTALLNTVTPNPAVITLTNAAASVVRLGSLAAQTGSLQVTTSGVLTTTTASIGEAATGTGAATVTSSGQWTNGGSFTVGNLGAGTLNVTGGGTLTIGNGFIGNGAGSTGSATVTGTGSQWTNTGQLLVGNSGAGTLSISQGGAVYGTSVVLGSASAGSGSVTVSGTGSRWTNTGQLGIGNSGTGSVSITSGGAVSGTSAVIGSATAGSGSVIVSGTGSSWANSSFISVGNSGTGVLRVENGASVSSVGGATRNAIGRVAGSTGSVTVTGSGSSWTAVGNIEVASSGTGTLTISDRAVVGPGGSTILANNNVGLFDGSKGTLLIESGGKLTGTNGYLGGTSSNNSNETLSDGRATVTGQDSVWTLNGVNGANPTDATLAVGQSGKGQLDIANGGAVRLTANTSKVFVAFGSQSTGILNIAGGGTLAGGTADIGTRAGAIGTATVSGATSRWDNTGQLTVGNSGTGTLQVSNGASLTSDGGTTGSIIGRSAGSYGEVTITGSGSTWAAKGSIHTGYSGTGKLVIADGAQVAAEVNGSFGNNNVGLNAGSNGTLRIESGGSLSGGSGTVGGAAGATGTATVTGQGSRWLNSGILNVGSTGTGTLLLEKGGYVTSDGGTVGSSIGRFGGSVGLVTLTDPDTLWSVKGSVHVGYEGKGTLIVSNGASISAMGTPPYGNINVGLSNGSDGTLLIESGGTASGLYGMIGGTVNASAANEGTSRGQATVTGQGSAWTVGDTLSVGQSGNGRLTISDGARVSAAIAVNVGFGGVSKGALQVDSGGTLAGATATIGSSSGASGTATVTGAGSAWTTTGVLTVGRSGSGVLTLADKGTARASSVVLASIGGSSGTLNIGAASGSAAEAAGALDAASVTFGAGAGTLVFNHTDGDYRFAPVLSGAGSIKAESGRTVLTGESAGFTGETAISSAATLQVGDGATAGSLGGSFLDNGLLVFDRADDIQFGGSMSGTGTLEKAGAGMLLLTGDSRNLTGPTTLSAGHLRVDGSLAGSTVTARSGTTLSGTGTVGGVVAQAGSTVAPGDGNLGTLGVKGDYRQLAGSTYDVEVVQGSSKSDRIAITGKATLDQGSILDVSARGTGDYTINDNFTVLTAAGGVSGTYLLTGETAISGFYQLEAIYDANNVYLRARQTRDFGDAALTPNQNATADGLQSLPADNALRDAVGALTSDAEARAAFDQLSGEVHPSIAGAMVQDSRFVRESAVGRLRCTGAERPKPGKKEGCAQGRVWSQAYGAWQNTDGDGNAADFSDDVNGFVVGADAPLGAGWQAGVLAGTAHADYAVSARNSSGSSDSYSLGAYAGTGWNNIGIRLGAAYSWYDIDTTRNVAFTGFSDSLDARYQAGTAQFFGDIGYTLELGQASLEPFASLAQVNVHSDGFSEDGGDAAVSAGDADTNVTFSTLGVRTAANFSAAGLRWTASGMAGWQHGWGDLTPEMAMNFPGSDSFTVRGAPIAEDAAAVEVGLAAGEDDISIGLFYQGQFGDGFAAQGATARLSFAF